VVLAIKDVKADDVRNRLKVMDTELDRKKSGGGKNTFFPLQRVLLAALVVLAIGSTLLLFQKGASRPSINTGLLPIEEGLPVLMSTSGTKAFDDAMSLFKAGEYNEAADGFLPLLELQPTNDTLLYYTGNALLRSGRPDDALPLFEQLTSSNSTEYTLKAGVYLALCHWEAGVKQEALSRLREISLLENHPYRNEAKSLFEVLGSPR
jgi:tetratricopeptide (TPR) repeat protein